jgi:hypothetical protein
MMYGQCVGVSAASEAAVADADAETAAGESYPTFELLLLTSV